MTDKLYTRKEVAEILCVKPRTLWHWEKRGIIKATLHIGCRPRYSASEIERVVGGVALFKQSEI